jgi:membrane protease YdiL (CAAX protease family)
MSTAYQSRISGKPGAAAHTLCGMEPTPEPQPAATTPGLHDFYAPPVATATWVGQQKPVVAESGLPVKPALVVTGVGLLLSFGLSRIAGTLAGDSAVLDERLRRALVITLVFYVLLGGALAWFCSAQRVGLTWVRGHVADALLLGLPLGLVGGALAVGLNSAVAGHLSSDPNVELLVGGGGILRISLTLAVTAVLAPLVEETLFRGVLAGSLLAVGTRTAMWVSAIAFAIWHMNPVSLRYYVLMGLLLAALWHKRGLVCSMATHAAFNGVLTLAAVVATGGAGHLTHYGQLSFSLPGGWHADQAVGRTSNLSIHGPAGAGMQLSTIPVRTNLSAADMLTAFGNGRADVMGVQFTRGTAHLVPVSGGEAVVADLVTQGEPGHILELMDNGTLYQLIVLTAGSPGAERDWRHVLDTIALHRG